RKSARRRKSQTTVVLRNPKLQRGAKASLTVAQQYRDVCAEVVDIVRQDSDVSLAIVIEIPSHNRNRVGRRGKNLRSTKRSVTVAQVHIKFAPGRSRAVVIDPCYKNQVVLAVPIKIRSSKAVDDVVPGDSKQGFARESSGSIAETNSGNSAVNVVRK